MSYHANHASSTASLLSSTQLQPPRPTQQLQSTVVRPQSQRIEHYAVSAPGRPNSIVRPKPTTVPSVNLVARPPGSTAQTPITSPQPRPTTVNTVIQGQVGVSGIQQPSTSPIAASPPNSGGNPGHIYSSPPSTANSAISSPIPGVSGLNSSIPVQTNSGNSGHIYPSPTSSSVGVEFVEFGPGPIFLTTVHFHRYLPFYNNKPSRYRTRRQRQHFQRILFRLLGTYKRDLRAHRCQIPLLRLYLASTPQALSSRPPQHHSYSLPVLPSQHVPPPRPTAASTHSSTNAMLSNFGRAAGRVAGRVALRYAGKLAMGSILGTNPTLVSGLSNGGLFDNNSLDVLNNSLANLNVGSTGVDMSTFQAAFQGVPGTDYQSIISSIGQQQQTSPTPGVNYHAIISALMKIQQQAAHSQGAAHPHPQAASNTNAAASAQADANRYQARLDAQAQQIQADAGDDEQYEFATATSNKCRHQLLSSNKQPSVHSAQPHQQHQQHPSMTISTVPQYHLLSQPTLPRLSLPSTNNIPL
ncbi:hypothetical protein BT96DRAFT_195971 [Gymnopus androsaceus JB14]|uniref:Uncharacterized protein n=1 Tax=Gymnopus androsaceus JB14 TaxID=1447944 RepID=A0A6A4HAF5_9AGAR|nr:hypothetical protein BT96DRAFT_195971 [Gymnopus androsaceus JB14]